MSSFKVTAGRDGSRRTFDEHDDRDRYDNGGGGGGRGGGGGGMRRGQSRRNNARGGFYKRGRGLNPRSRLGGNDDDVDMGNYDGAFKNRDRYLPYSKRHPSYGRKTGNMGGGDDYRSAPPRLGGGGGGGVRGGGRGARGGGGGRRGRVPNQSGPLDPRSGWFKVSVSHMDKLDRKTLYQMLNDNMTVPFIPVGYYMEGSSGVFFVDDINSARALKSVNRRITMPSGFKILVTVRGESKLPCTTMDDSVKEKLKVVMSSRYDPSSKSMNLANLYNDASLNAEGIRLVINRRSVMDVVLNVINEHIPELLSLDLSDNQLFGLETMTDIAGKAPNLIKLDISKNKLKSIHDLSKIRGLKLVSLQLEGNPLCDHFKDDTSYVSAVRKPFPKITHLDGHDLPPPVTFDVDDIAVLPPSKGSYFMSEDVQKRVCAFLEQYIKIYDSNDRQSLLDAYHDNAVYSMTVSYNKLLPHKQNLSQYMETSRNLNRLADSGRRSRYLKSGRLSIVSALSELPASEHDLASFIVDVGLATTDLMSFTLRGLFRETNSRMDGPPIRYFSRTFVTVPQGAGIVIINEQYTITPASQKQVKEAFRTPAPTPSSSPVMTAPPAVPSTLTPELKMEMVTQFSQQSRMNQAFSQRCLEENAWDYDTAARIFIDLQEKGSIPPEAFQ